MRIVLTGSGSGGHITPLLAVAEALQTEKHELHYIGLGRPEEEQILGQADLQRHRIISGKWRRYWGERWWQQLSDLSSLGRNLLDVCKIMVGCLQSLYLLLTLRPQAVFCKGGYGALPVGLAAALLRIPLVTHDSDAVPGLTNHILQRFARATASGFPVPGRIFTGNPLRRAIMESQPLSRSDTTKPLLLVLGGSLGASSLNAVIFAAAPALQERFEVIHQTGSGDLLAAPRTAGYQAVAFIGAELGGLLKTAELVVARAGANTIAELAFCGLPSLLVPGAQLTGGQQLANAQILADARAAIVLQQADLNPETLVSGLDNLLWERQRYSEAIRLFYQPGAAVELAGLITMASQRDRAGG